jgi:hypothetical protein
MVLEETYSQEVVPPLGIGARADRLQRRRLRSDLLLVRPKDDVTWVQFRDVFEVDGRSVRDREERLTKLFLRSDISGSEQVRQVVAESTRYNIGHTRTMNVPLLPLSVLDAASQPRFHFTVAEQGDEGRPRIGNATVASTPAFRVTAEVWIVHFEERQRPTLVRTTGDADIFSRGRFWIEPATGRVLMGEMITEDDRIRGELVVSYQTEGLQGQLVPLELRERYSEGVRRATTTGTATYSNFRRFQVQAEETISPVR